MVRINDADLNERMQTICRRPAPKYHGVLFQWNLRDAISEARNGDKIAAREAVAYVSLMVGNYMTDRATEKRYYQQLPEYAREYLCEALDKIGAGKDANEAFHFMKPGPAKWSAFNRLYAADLVYRLIEETEGLPQRRACDFVASFLADTVNAHGNLNTPPCSDILFFLNPISGATLEKWYIELRGTIATVIHNASLEKSGLN